MAKFALMSTLRRNSHWLIIALGVALRLIGLGRDALWYDEAFTAWLARLPLPDMLNAIAGDVHPPAWYLVEWLMVRVFGASETALRSPACVLGIVNLWLAWVVARRLATKPIAVQALAIFALSPFQIYYSQEARMYGLLQFAVLAATWAALSRRWAAMAGAGLLGLLTHNLMVVYLVPIFALAIGRDWVYVHQAMRARVIDWHWLRSWGGLVAGLAIVINYAPWAWWLLLPQIGEVGAGFWVQPLSAGGFFYPVYILLFHVAAPAWLALHAGMLIVALVLWGSMKAWAGHRTILVLAWGPLVILAIISLVWRPVYLHRTLIGSSLFLYLLAAVALQRLAQVLARPWWMVALALAPMLIIPTANYYLSPEARRWDVRQDAAAVMCEPGDVVYHVNLASLILFQYYLPGCDHWVWPAANDLSQSLTQRTKQAMGMQQADLTNIPHRRARLIWAETPVMNESEPGAVAHILLNNNYRLVHQAEPADLVTLRIWEVWR